jgi:hypothetical protein
MANGSSDPRHFIIGDKCGPEQRAIFEALNQCLDKLEISPDKFDRYFRLCLMQQCAQVAESAQVFMLKPLPSEFKQRLFRRAPDLAQIAQNEGAFTRALTEQGIMSVHLDEPRSVDHFLASFTAIKLQHARFTSEIAANINKKFGRFQDVNPADFKLETEHHVYDNFRKLTKDTPSAPRQSAERFNLLQQMADGARDIIEKQGTYGTWRIPGARFETGALSNYVYNSLMFAIRTAAAQKGWDEKRLAQELKPTVDIIDHNWTILGKYVPPDQRKPAPPPEPSAEELAAAEQRRQAHDEAAARQREQALLDFIPYGTAPRLESLKTRATRTNPPPLKELADAWAQAAPLAHMLNNNFPPHTLLGDALFSSHDGHVLSVVDHICVGSRLPEAGEQRTAIRTVVMRVLSEPPETMLPAYVTPGLGEALVKKNHERHEQVIKKFVESPLLVIAALGTSQMIDDARAAYSLLYPERKRDIPDEATQKALREEIRQVAGNAIKQAFADANKPLPASLAAAIPEPPVPPPSPGAADWEHLRRRAEEFVGEKLKDQPPYNMFRCNLDMRPGHAVTLHLSRWVNGGGHRRVETCSDTILLNEPSLERALEMKKRLQSHVLNTMPVTEHRRLHEGHYITTDADFLPSTAPIPDPNRAEPDGRAGRIIKRGGVHALKLIFPDNTAAAGESPRVEAEIPLGVRQGGDFEEANRRRIMVLDHLDQVRHHKRRVTSQDVRVWLQNEIVRGGKTRWEQAESIDLRDRPSVQNDIAVQFPGPAGEATTLHVDTPKLEGTPNAFWTVPVSIRLNGKEMVKTTVNTHIRDADMALERINEITSHFKTELERHAAANPGSHWQLGADGRLMQFNEEHLQKNRNVDWTRLDRIKDQLGYVRQLSVRISPPQEANAKGPDFTLNVQRADGSDFLRDLPGHRGGAPLTREIAIGASMNAADKAAVAEKFREAVHASFTEAVNEAYRPQRDPAFESGGEPARKALQRYDSRSIVGMFEAACRHAEQQEFATQANLISAPGRLEPSSHADRTTRSTSLVQR